MTTTTPIIPTPGRPLLAVIHEKCVDCSGGRRAEVARCPVVKCALWPYRSGHSPFAKARGPGKKFAAKLAALPAANGLSNEGSRST
jgi:hypothetical protein